KIDVHREGRIFLLRTHGKTAGDVTTVGLRCDAREIEDAGIVLEGRFQLVEEESIPQRGLGDGDCSPERGPVSQTRTKIHARECRHRFPFLVEKMESSIREG